MAARDTRVAPAASRQWNRKTSRVLRGLFKNPRFGLGGGDWDKDKYQAKPDDPDGQLYNMESDIEEKMNLYDRHPDRVRTLWNALEEIKFQGHSRSLKQT